MTTNEFVLDGAKILHELKRRTLIVENRDGRQLLSIGLVWALVILLFLTPVAVVAAIIGIIKEWRLRVVVAERQGGGMKEEG